MQRPTDSKGVVILFHYHFSLSIYWTSEKIVDDVIVDDVIVCILLIASCLIIHCRSHEFDSIANKFIEELCYNIILWDTGSIEESEEMRKVLRLSLPIITC